MSNFSNKALATVYDDRLRCIGFVLARRHEFEAYDADASTSLGVFETADAAVAAIRCRHNALERETGS